MPKKPARRWADSTLAVHSGEPKHGLNAPVTSPVVRAANFTFANTAEMKRWAEGKSEAYIYTRYGNPTLAVAEAKIADLENAEAGLVTASGSAAISSALLSVLQSGDELIAVRQLYGGSYRLMRDILPRMGIRVHHVGTDLDGVERLVNEKTRAFYVESPTNPTLGFVDLKKVVALCKRHKLVALVDNTFATPILQKPLDMGFDLVAHSATKYLAGHSDIIAGAVAGSRERVGAVRKMVIYLGGSLDPDAAYLLIRGLKTLEIRVRRQCETAMAVAEFLEGHPKIERVHYPGLASHPDHRLAKEQMKGFGGMMAFELKGGLAAARRLCDKAQIFLLAASLGGTESLVVLPIYTSHYRMSTAELAAAGVKPGTVRMSVGLEDSADLIADLRQALA
ncbi:MAG TPA: aminotransferase class I/II-fold pyridoxal phosphate-dependent enzyme [Candidatus Sulfotelmatobacter sp.]|nr:aminotransferase class I/II-fold pyridoxal phosphate-dependent enzyme [Candidatus Sulfotelmatobacter sp.]